MRPDPDTSRWAAPARKGPFAAKAHKDGWANPSALVFRAGVGITLCIPETHDSTLGHPQKHQPFKLSAKERSLDIMGTLGMKGIDSHLMTSPS